MQQLKKAALLISAFTISLGATTITPIGTLDTIIASHSTYATGIVVGDKVFYNFNFTGSCIVDGGSGGACPNGTGQSGYNAAALTFSTYLDVANNLYGFRLTGAIEATSFQDMMGNYHDVLVDDNLSYQVETLRTVPGTPGSGAPLISDVHLGASAALNPPCPGTCQNPPPSVTIGETVNNLNGTSQLGTLTVTDPPPHLLDVALIAPPVSGISVTKDIKVESGIGTFGGVSKYADVTLIDQLVSQVPEPRAYAAIMLFLVGLFVVNRKRKLA